MSDQRLIQVVQHPPPLQPPRLYHRQQPLHEPAPAFALAADDGFTLGRDGFPATFSWAGRSLEESIDLLPLGEPLIPFLDGQLSQRAPPAQPGQVRVGQPTSQPLPNQDAIRRGTAVQLPGPGSEVEYQ